MMMGWIDSSAFLAPGLDGGGDDFSQQPGRVVDNTSNNNGTGPSAVPVSVSVSSVPQEAWMDPSPESYPLQDMSPYQTSLTSQYSPATPNMDPPLFLPTSTSDGLGYSNGWFGDMEQVAPFSLFNDAAALGDVGVVAAQHPLSKSMPAPTFPTAAPAQAHARTGGAPGQQFELQQKQQQLQQSKDKFPNDSGVETEDEPDDAGAHPAASSSHTAASTAAATPAPTAPTPLPATDPAPAPTPASSAPAAAAAARSSSPKRNPRQLRTASRVPKRRKPGASPSPPPDGPPEVVQARAAHNKVEQQYRKRLNQYFERLLAVLPTGGEDGEDGGGGVAADERRTSKAEVLEQARKRILELERRVVALEQRDGKRRRV